MEISKLYEIFLRYPQITTDSRDCPEGSIFFALKGASFNGNAFAAKALELGCAYAVIDEKEYAADDDERFIVVDDCLKTMQQLANYHRRALRTKIVGVTGTNGKTTTKELISAVLSEKYNVLYTLGNFNNHIGVPKTLLRLTKEHDIAVVEMGANHPGEIKELVEIVEPNYGIITNVGRAHLQGFGSFEGVKRTKGELYDFLCGNGRNSVVFINEDNKDLIQMADEHGVKQRVRYGQINNSNLTVKGEVISCAPFLKFRWRVQDADAATKSEGAWHEVQTHIIGSYNTDNMLAAATIGMFFGVTEEAISMALAGYVPSNNRSQMTVTESNRLIVDAYNANPTSMSAALKNFRDMEVSPKMAILGEMGELGDVSGEEHRKIVDILAAAGIDKVWLVGNEFIKTDCSFRKFGNVDKVKEAIANEHPQGYYILIKGSHSTRLYELPAIL